MPVTAVRCALRWKTAAYEGSLADRKRALRQSRKFLEQFTG